MVLTLREGMLTTKGGKNRAFLSIKNRVKILKKDYKKEVVKA